jgi:ATP-dependent RNA helicase RhlB
MHAIADLGFQYCTPIQAQILPKIIEGSDVAGRSQTGTGKTAAFLISTFTYMIRHPLSGHRQPATPRMLVLAPTRELVLQIDAEAKAIGKYLPLEIQPVFGGMDFNRQMRELKRCPVDVIVATPGRLLDFVQRQRCLNLSQVETLVIDEADRMLDMGFIPDVRTIVYCTPPKAKRQTMFFSATLTETVTRLAASWTRDPVTIQIEPSQVASKSVEQLVYLCTDKDKFTLLYNILKHDSAEQVLVFGNRRDVTDRLMRRLHDLGLNCALLSGDVPQERRLKTLDAFKAGRIRVLVATDVAGRGIHVEGISHVINYNLPEDPEDYVHRIGRTGRVGATGISVSFACEEDSVFLPEIEKYMGQKLKCTYPDESLLAPVPMPTHGRITALAPTAYERRPPRSGGRRPGGDRRRR